MFFGEMHMKQRACTVNFSVNIASLKNALKCKGLEDARGAYVNYLWWREKAGFRPEDARFKLANETKTEVAATYNFRTWRHIFQERGLNHRAQWEIRSIAQMVLAKFAEIWPSVFGDLEDRIPAVVEKTDTAWAKYVERMAETQADLRGTDFTRIPRPQV